MTTINVTNLPPAPFRSQLLDKDGIMTVAWSRWFGLLWERSGGSAGTTIYDNVDGQAVIFPKSAVLSFFESQAPAPLMTNGVIQQVLDIVPSSFRVGISTPTYIQFDTTSAGSTAVGQLAYSSTEGGLEFKMSGGNVTQQIGQEVLQNGRNRTGSTILNGTVVYVLGAVSDRLEIAVASNASATTAHGTLGVTTEDIANNSNGWVTVLGHVHDLNTNAFNEGDTLWLGVAGAMTNVQPVAPLHKVRVGIVVRKHPTQGIVYVNPQPAGDINDLDDVYVPAPSNGDVLTYDTANSRWKSNAPATSGTVTSVSGSGGTTGLTLTGGPITVSGTLTLGGTLAVANGGTGVTTSTGTGSVVLSNTPTLVTPVIGAATGTSVVLSSSASASAFIPTGATVPTNGMYLPAASTVGFSTGTALRMEIDSAGKVLVNTTTAVHQLTVRAADSDGVSLLNSAESSTRLYLQTRGGGTANRRGVLQAYRDTVGGITLVLQEDGGGITSPGTLAMNGASSTLGYGTGSGGTVTQATSKSTGVTLNKSNGQIVMNGAALAASTSVAFTLTNSLIAATDVIAVTIASGATSLAYITQVQATAAGSCSIAIRNVSAGSLSEAVTLNFAIIKSVTA